MKIVYSVFLIFLALQANAQDAALPSTPILRKLMQGTSTETVTSKPKPSTGLKRGTAYLLTYQGEDEQWYETDVVATGRWAKFCDGIRHEVKSSDFSYFASQKELRRIFSN